MQKQVIAIDIDDTLFDHFADLAKWYSEKFDTTLTLADNHPKTESARKAWNAKTKSEAILRVHQFFKTEEFKTAVPYDHALEVIPTLARRYRILFITARDMEILEEFTREWVEAHFGGQYEAIHFTAEYSLTGKNRTKREVCEAEGVSFLIDDSLENCIEVAESGIEALLYGVYPWNQADSLPQGVARAKDWNEVKQYFDGR